MPRGGAWLVLTAGGPFANPGPRRSATEALADAGQVQRWDGSGWVPVADVAAHLSTSEENRYVAVEVPPLDPGEYRVLLEGAGGPQDGRFWVTDVAPPPPDVRVLEEVHESDVDLASIADGAAPNPVFRATVDPARRVLEVGTVGELGCPVRPTALVPHPDDPAALVVTVDDAEGCGGSTGITYVIAFPLGWPAGAEPRLEVRSAAGHVLATSVP